MKKVFFYPKRINTKLSGPKNVIGSKKFGPKFEKFKFNTKITEAGTLQITDRKSLYGP